MPIAVLRFNVDGEQQVSRAFQAYEYEVRRMGESGGPLEKIGEEIRKAVEEQFTTEGARSGAAWPPLSPEYAAWKETHFPGRPLLMQYGDMRRAMTSSRSFSIHGNTLIYEPDSRSDHHPEIAGFHQRGSGNNPVRKMVDLTPDDKRGFERIVHEWLIQKRRGVIGGQ